MRYLLPEAPTTVVCDRASQFSGLQNTTFRGESTHLGHTISIPTYEEDVGSVLTALCRHFEEGLEGLLILPLSTDRYSASGSRAARAEVDCIVLSQRWLGRSFSRTPVTRVLTPPRSWALESRLV